MASQIYKNTTEEWSEKLLQCPYDPVHQIRPERFRYDFTIKKKIQKNLREQVIPRSYFTKKKSLIMFPIVLLILLGI